MEISKKEKNILLNVKNKYFTSVVWRVLKNKIEEDLEKGKKIREIANEISTILGKKISYNALRQKIYRERRKSNRQVLMIKNIDMKNIVDILEKMKKNNGKVIVTFQFKDNENKDIFVVETFGKYKIQNEKQLFSFPKKSIIVK